MYIDPVILGDPRDKIEEILIALNNRLTLADNFAGEGTIGQIPVSQGANSPPVWTDAADVLTSGGSTTLPANIAYIDVTNVFQVDQTFDRDIIVAGDAVVTGNTDITGTLDVTGLVTLSGNLAVDVINEVTAAGGVTLDSVLLKDGGGLFSGGVKSTGFVAESGYAAGIVVDVNADSAAQARYGAAILFDALIATTHGRYGMYVEANARHTTGTMAQINGIFFSAGAIGAGSTTALNAILARTAAQTNAVVSSAAAINIQPPVVAGGGSISTAFGLYVNPITVAGTNYAILTNAGLVYFGDNLQFAAGRQILLNASGADEFVMRCEATLDVVTANPTTDAPSDWVHFRIGGADRYLPAYAL